MAASSLRMRGWGREARRAAVVLACAALLGTTGCAHGTSPTDEASDETGPWVEAPPTAQNAREAPQNDAPSDDAPTGPIDAYPAGAVATFAPDQSDPTRTMIFVYGPRPSETSKPIAKLEAPSVPGAIASIAFDGARRLYTVDYSGRINVFASGASGQSAPVRTINPDGLYTNADWTYAEAVAIDSKGHVYMSLDTYPNHAGPNSVLVYDTDATGPAVPERIIAGPHTGFRAPIQLAFDRDDNLFVGDYLATSVFVFGKDADGDQSPTRVACVSNGLSAIAVAPNGRLYVAPEGVPGWSVEVYEPFDGTSQKLAGAIRGPNTGLDGPNEYPLAMGLDPAGGLVLIGPQAGLRWNGGALGDVAPAGSFAGWNALAVAPRTPQ